MNDIRQVFERVLADAPEPPRSSAAEVLAQARHADRRLNRLAAGASGLAVAAVAAALAFAAPTPAPTGGVAGSRSQTVVAESGVPSAATVEKVPTAAAAQAHGGQIFLVLAAAVPHGLSTGVVKAEGDSTQTTITLQFGGSPGGYTSETGVLASDGTRAGSVSAIWLGDATPAPSGDLCAAAIGARLARFSNPDGTCATITVGGVPVRASTAPDGGSVVATRFFADGCLSVRASRSVAPLQPGDLNSMWWIGSGLHAPPLTAAPLTIGQAATLAADPALVP